MMNEFACALKKDYMELMRKRKFMVFIIASFGIGLMIFIASLMLPAIVDLVSALAPQLISGADSMQELMDTFFPSHVQGNIGLLASNLMVFYVVVIVILCYKLLPDEYTNGRWDMPRACGYHVGTLIWSKALIYSVFSALPVFFTYVIYYLAISATLTDTLGLVNAIKQGLLAAVCIFAVMMFTIFGSVIFKHGIVNAISVISITLFAPDIFTFFNFEKYLPTYPFTFVKNAWTRYGEITVSLLILIGLCVVYGFIAAYVFEKRVRE